MEGLSADERKRIAGQTPKAPSKPDLADEWKLLREAQAAYEAKARAADKRLSEAERREQGVTNRETALKADRKKTEKRWQEQSEELAETRAALARHEKALDDRKLHLDGREGALNQRDRTLDRREAALNDRQAAIAEREQAAEAGFIERNKKSLGQLEEQLQALRVEADAARARIAAAHAEFDRERIQRREALEAELAAHREQRFAALADELRERRDAAEREVAERRTAVEAELTGLRADLDDQRAALREREGEVHRIKGRLDLEKTLLGEDRAALDDEIERRAADRIQALQDEARAEQRRRETVEAERDRLFADLEARRALDRAFDGKEPTAVLDELERLRDRVAEAQRELDARPGRAAEERLIELEEQLRAARADCDDLRAGKARAEAQASAYRVDAATHEQLVREKEVLEIHRETLKVAVDELRRDVGELREKGGAANPFSECAAMDGTVELKEPIPLDGRPLDLERFATRVRHRIAHDPSDASKRLCYTERDIRSFIGGLSMSRLHLLQGISGTGKTSLPRAFARAIGGATLEDAAIDLVEVQAGWRDQLDLLGHYNAFQRRFYESEFLKALYRAGTPAHAGRPFIIVLDEMNLSRPEQYFATLLSALERPDDAQITLMEHAPQAHPSRFVADGRKIALPPNVWFVGTANHDETTVEFADKTYDRAHVMELPRQRESFRPDMRLAKPPSEPLALATLQGAFDTAIEKHGADARAAMKTLAGSVGTVLDRRFRVGWGNRLEDQVQRYAPVIIAAGGSMGEAMDHILATKILRKVRDRYDTSTDDIEALYGAITENWESIDGNHDPDRSLKILGHELDKKKSGSGR